MKSEEKAPPTDSRPTVKDGKSERQEREAAALRANLRRRKQQKAARQGLAPAGPDSEGKKTQ